MAEKKNSSDCGYKGCPYHNEHAHRLRVLEEYRDIQMRSLEGKVTNKSFTWFISIFCALFVATMMIQYTMAQAVAEDSKKITDTFELYSRQISDKIGAIQQEMGRLRGDIQVIKAMAEQRDGAQTRNK